jgi:periplasmic protein TonB
MGSSIVVGMKAVIAVVVLLAGSSCGFASQDQSASPSPTPTPSPTATPSANAFVPGTKRVRISSGVADSLIRHKVDPVYPRKARKNDITGDVLVRIIIDRQGNVTNLAVIQGDPILVKSAVKAVKQWKYRPFILNGEAIEAESVIKIQYHM